MQPVRVQCVFLQCAIWMDHQRSGRAAQAYMRFRVLETRHAPHTTGENHTMHAFKRSLRDVFAKKRSGREEKRREEKRREEKRREEKRSLEKRREAMRREETQIGMLPNPLKQ